MSTRATSHHAPQPQPGQTVAPQSLAATEPSICVPQQDGVLVLDKPKGPTSAWCISRVKRVLSQKKIGHAGTLDPMASGVLLILLGQATKLSGYLMDGGDKTYSGVIHLGIVTDTWDAEGQILAEHPVPSITQADVERAIAPLVGEYMQEVPAYSAAKHQGKPLYALARKGLETPVKEKIVTVSRCEVELVDPRRIHFRVTCGSGTYIRSLAHSLGSRLGCGGMLEKLTREHSHPFSLNAAHSLESVLAEPEGFAQKVIGIADALPGWPKLRVTAEQEARVKNGSSLSYCAESLANMPFVLGTKAILLTEANIPLALAETAASDGKQVWALIRGLWNQ